MGDQVTDMQWVSLAMYVCIHSQARTGTHRPVQLFALSLQLSLVSVADVLLGDARSAFSGGGGRPSSCC